jgi:DNA topoisomerase I
LPAEATDEALTLALKALSLPRQLRKHPQTGKTVEVNIGRFGPYVKHDGSFKSIPKAESVYDIDLDRAVELLAEAKTKGGGGRKLGAHPEDERAVAVHEGRYGPYIKHGTINATIPASIDPEKITLEEAIGLLTAKASKGGGGRKAARATAAKAKARKKPQEKAAGTRATGKKKRKSGS